MGASIEKFEVDTRPSKAVVVDSLIRDITIEACIFDLIDNSIDAARDSIYRRNPELKGKPPASYEGYSISISMDGEEFCIRDNCGGITKNDLEKSVLRFGERSAHKSGIGVFGVGLNRAIFKLGRNTFLESDTGRELCILKLDTAEYLRDKDNWMLPAERRASTKKTGTKLTISELPAETSKKLSDKHWEEDFVLELGRRYGRFIEKGLEIEVNEDHVESNLIKLRDDSPYGKETKFFKLPNGITVYLESGQHIKHKFSAEANYSKEANRPLTPQYGWNIFCNERAVIISDQTWKTGWSGKFHTQFYGFVGNVYFSCEDPESLPWSTTKADVDLNSSAYQEALREMKTFVQTWRTNSEDAKLKARQKEELAAPAPKPSPQPNPGGGKPANAPKPKLGAKTGPVKKPTKKIDHNTFETILPDDIDQHYCHDKLLALVHEAQSLNLHHLSYSGLILIRVLFEVSSVCFLTRKQLYAPLIKSLIQKRNSERTRMGKSPLSKTEEKNVSPTLDEVINHFETHSEIWSADVEKNIRIGLKKFAQHKEKLNNAVHSPFHTISKYEGFNIREDVLPILRYLIETK